MAGLGETCSHIAALVFLIEYSIKKISGISCTDEVNKWLPPCLKSVPFNKIQDMDFRSSDCRLSDLVNGTMILLRIFILQTLLSFQVSISTLAFIFFLDVEPAHAKDDSVCHLVTKPTEEANNLFLAKLSELSPYSAVLSSHPEYCKPFIPPQVTNDLPKDLSTLSDSTAVGMPYQDLLDLCSNLMKVRLQLLCSCSA